MKKCDLPHFIGPEIKNTKSKQDITRKSIKKISLFHRYDILIKSKTVREWE